jgi:hypothetical protein
MPGPRWHPKDPFPTEPVDRFRHGLPPSLVSGRPVEVAAVDPLGLPLLQRPQSCRREKHPLHMATSQDSVVLVDCRQDLSIALNAVSRFAKRNLKAFSAKEEALDWPATQ